MNTYPYVSSTPVPTPEGFKTPVSFSGLGVVIGLVMIVMVIVFAYVTKRR